MTIEGLVGTDPIAVTRHATVSEVASLMSEEQVENVIIEKDDHPVGIVTDRDIVVNVTAEGRNPSDVTAADVMTGDSVTADRDVGMMK